VHWSDGGLVDIEKIGFAFREHGASLVVRCISCTRYVSDARQFYMGERDHFISSEMASTSIELMVEWGAACATAALRKRVAHG
jgi:hypothetical protein